MRKNQGRIVEAPPNVIGFDGEWAEFPGSTATYIEYPPLPIINGDEIMIGCRVRDLVDTTADAALIAQYHGVLLADRSMLLKYNGTTVTFEILFI